MELSEIKHSRPRSYLRDAYTLLHLPRFMFIVCFMIIGAFMAPRVNWTVFILEVIAVSGGVLLTAYRLDEMKGGHVSANIPKSHHKISAVIGLIIMFGIGAYLIITVHWTLIFWAILGFVGVVLYNFEIGGKVSHNELVFGLTWAFTPVCASYYMQTLTLTVPVILFGLFAMVVAAHHIWSYGMCRCYHSGTCKEYLEHQEGHKKVTPFRRICHGMECQARLVMPTEVHKHGWELINVQFYTIIVLTLVFVTMHFSL